MNHNKMMRMAQTGLLTALVCAATMVIRIPTPNGGYVNIGDALVLLSGWMLGPVYGFFAAGVGSALADLLWGYGSYVPGTLIIKGCMGLVAALTVRKSRLLGGIAGEVIMVGGYFLYESTLLGYGMAAAASIPGNAVQGVVGLVLDHSRSAETTGMGGQQSRGQNAGFMTASRQDGQCHGHGTLTQTGNILDGQDTIVFHLTSVTLTAWA